MKLYLFYSLLITTLTVACVSLADPIIMEPVKIQSLGPQPFSKDKTSPLDITLPKNDPSSDNKDILHLNNNHQDGIPTFKTPVDENQNVNLINLAPDSLPSFNNETKIQLGYLKPSDDSISSGSRYTKTQQKQRRQSSTAVKKPSGTLYVDSAHTIQHPATPLRMGGTPGCRVDADNNIMDDPHHLSGSDFGFPKSIVGKAMEDSPFAHVLNYLAKQHYYNFHQQHKSNMNDKQHKNTAPRLDQFSDSGSIPSQYKNFGNDPFTKPVSNSNVFDSNIGNNNINGYDTFLKETTKLSDSSNGVQIPFHPPKRKPYDFRTAYVEKDDDVDSFTPHLLEGSVFSSAEKPNSPSANIVKNKSHPIHYPTNSTTNVLNSTLKDEIENAAEVMETDVDVNESHKQTKENNFNFSKYLPDVSGGDSLWPSQTNNQRYDAFSDLSNSRPSQTNNQGYDAFSDLSNNRPSQTNNQRYDAFSDLSNNRPSQTNNQRYDAFSDLSNNRPSQTNNQRYDAFSDLSSSRPSNQIIYKENKKFSGIINNLFPPRKSEKLPEVSGLKDLIPTTNPVIKYSDEKKSNVDSPFEFNIKSIFGSIPGSNLGSQENYNNIEFKSSSISSNSGVPNVFGFLGSGLKSPSSPNYNGRNLNIHGTHPAADHNSIRYLEYKTRRKRETRDQESNTMDTCQASYSTLRQYNNHGGACFVVLPDVQMIQFATCPKGTCSGCLVNGGSSHCTTVRIPMWVWAYCEEGPNAGAIAADRVTVAVACSCQVTHCRRVPMGTS